MSREIIGVNLDALRDPIWAALRGYENASEGALKFDLNKAIVLNPTDGPNSARSETDVKYHDHNVGTLYVIAFKPGDGTGKEADHKLADLEVAAPYPRTTNVVPRIKKDVHSEGHLAIVTQQIDSPNATPELYAGRFDLLGLDDKKVVNIGWLGQEEPLEIGTLDPVTTLTVGGKANGERFGDPHAVFSSRPEVVQVCGFLAITDDMYSTHGDVLASLHPYEPTA